VIVGTSPSPRRMVRGKSGGTLATLPKECRPKSRLIFGTSHEKGSTRIDVLPDGRVMWMAAGPDGWISLDGIAYAKEDIPADGLEVGEGWVPEDLTGTYPADSYRPPTVRKVGGLCVSSGLVSAKPGAGGLIATLPKECRPASQMVIIDGWSFEPNSSTTTWLSELGVTLPPGSEATVVPLTSIYSPSAP